MEILDRSERRDELMVAYSAWRARREELVAARRAREKEAKRKAAAEKREAKRREVRWCGVLGVGGSADRNGCYGGFSGRTGCVLAAQRRRGRGPR